VPKRRTHARAHALVGWLSGRLDLSVRPCGRARGVAGVGVVYHRVKRYYSDIARGHGPNENNSEVTGPTAAETATQHTKQKPEPSPAPQVSPTQQTGPASPSSEAPSPA
jgi:hypothetical protein